MVSVLELDKLLDNQMIYPINNLHGTGFAMLVLSILIFCSVNKSILSNTKDSESFQESVPSLNLQSL